MLKIAHLADIHIQDRRRSEYSEVFTRLYDSLNKEKPNIIVVAGDVFDNKMRASPHNLEDVAAFLSALVIIAPVVLIAGNHDTNCLTPGALDLLTPLVADHKDLQSDRFTYWRHSGIYTAHDIVWTVIATDGEQLTEEVEKKFIMEKQLHGKLHICLFHEEVNGALLPNGQQMKDFNLSTKSFDRYDLTMGGHIHLRQKITNRAAYCGSLIQQNIGESHCRHGYILWDVDAQHSVNIRGIDIKNDRGFVRIEIDAQNNDITELPIPSNPLYWELIHHIDVDPHIISYMQKYESLFGMPARAVRARHNTAITAKDVPKCDALVDAQIASRTIAAHEEIIRELITDKNIASAVIELHRNRWVEPNEISGGKFRITKFEFDNIYAYGAANVIDFKKLEGCVSGVIASNHTGKSSLIEALLFALYEEHPRAFYKKDIIHNGASSCHLMLEFELDGKVGRIIKGMFNGKNNSAGSQYRFEFDGENRTKGGTTETLAEIESVIGGSANAMASSFQIQGGESNGFISSTPGGRKKLISSVMSLGSFESLNSITSKELTECGSEVRVLESQYHGVSVNDLQQKLEVNEGNVNELFKEITKLTTTVQEMHQLSLTASQSLGVLIGIQKGSIELTLLHKECDLTSFSGSIGAMTSTEELIKPERSLDTTIDTTIDISLESVTLAYDKMIETADLASTKLYTHNLLRDSSHVLHTEELKKQMISTIALHDQIIELDRINTPVIPIYPRPLSFSEHKQTIGPRHSDEDINAAYITVSTVVDRTHAHLWDSFEYDRLCAIEPAAAAAYTLEMASSELELAKYEYKIATTELTILGPKVEDNIGNHVPTTTSIQDNMSILRQLQNGCVGCDHTRIVLIGNTTHAYHAAMRKLKIAESMIDKSELDVANAKKYSIFVDARQKLIQLDIARISAFNCKRYDEAVIIIENASYWSAIDIESWKLYDNNIANAEVRTLSIKQSTIDVENIKAQYKAAAAASAEYIIKLASAAADVLTADNSAKISKNHYDHISNNRRNMISSLKWWQENAIKIKDAKILAERVDAAQKINKLAEIDYNCVSAQLTSAQIRMTSYDMEISRLKTELIYERHRSEQHLVAINLYATLKAYRAVLNPTGGIGDRLLERGRRSLEHKINDSLRELGARFEIEITSDYDVRQRLPGKNWLPASLCSGYQKFVLSLAARLAIWRLSASPRPDAFIIDEGFGVCDEEYLESMASAIEALASAPGGPRLVFLVSHVDALKTRLDNALEIVIHPSGSQVTNSKDAVVQHTTHVDIVSLPIDPKNAKNVYCEICKQSISASRATSHLATAKHATAVKKQNWKK